MKQDGPKNRRRILRLQGSVRYSGVEAGPSPVRFSLSVPRDVVKKMELSKGDSFRFHVLGRILIYEPVGRPE